MYYVKNIPTFEKKTLLIRNSWDYTIKVACLGKKVHKGTDFFSVTEEANKKQSGVYDALAKPSSSLTSFSAKNIHCFKWNESIIYIHYVNIL